MQDSSSFADWGDSTWPLGYCSFYRCIVEWILTSCTSSCSVLNRKSLQREVKTAQHTSKTEPPSTVDLYDQHCRKRANKIIADPQHRSDRLFQLQPSGRRFHQTQEQFTSTGNTTVELSGHKHTLTIIQYVHISSTTSLFSIDLLYSHAPAVCRISNETDLHCFWNDFNFLGSCSYLGLSLRRSSSPLIAAVIILHMTNKISNVITPLMHQACT